MPDQPGKGPASPAPLSAEDADRIANSFTPFWEDDGDPAPTAVPAPVAAAPVSAAPLVVPAVRKPVGKQTLLGIAPPIIGRAAASTPVDGPAPVVASVVETQKLPAVAPIPAPALATVAASPPAPVAAPAPAGDAPSAPAVVTQPLPAVAAPPPPPAPLPHNKTQLGFSSPDEPARADASATPSPAVKSSPNVTGYAIAYTPKDGPSTPAVVIAPEAQSEPENKRPMSHTVPSRVRTTPVEALQHVQPTPALEDDDDFNPYAKKKGKGKLVGALLGGVAAIVVGVFAIRSLSGGSTAPASGSEAALPAKVETAAATRVEAAPAPAPAPTAAPEPAPSAALAASEAATPPVAKPTPVATAEKPTPAAKREPPPVAAKPAAVARPKAEPVAASPTRAAARAAVTPPSDTNSAPAKPASKGVIVRDAPF